MNIVTISGRARHGKDTTANIIKEYLEARGMNILITHYADLLKFICQNYFGWNGKKDEYGRRLLQYVGTDIIRKKNQDFWVDFVINNLKTFDDEWDMVIIPDARFPNEVHRLREEGFNTAHIKVIRPNFVSPLSASQQAHKSETAMDGVEPDVTFINDKDLEHYKFYVQDMWDNGARHWFSRDNKDNKKEEIIFDKT